MFLECRDLTFGYPNTDSYVFKEISFRIEKPGFHALFGPSGVGKTSFARVITGELKKCAGDLHIRKDAVLLYSYNQERLPGWSTVGRHLEKITADRMKEYSALLIDTFGLRDCMGLKFSQLSLGQQNRINLVRYLLQDFDLLIMDESLANVDERSKEMILFKIKDLFPRRHFFYISHNLIEVSKFCDTILVFRSIGQSPQALSIQGLNSYSKDTINKGELETVLLEIMNAC